MAELAAAQKRRSGHLHLRAEMFGSSRLRSPVGTADFYYNALGAPAARSCEKSFAAAALRTSDG